MPWTIVRATGFYWLLERMFENMARKRTIALPARAPAWPRSDEFAD